MAPSLRQAPSPHPPAQPGAAPTHPATRRLRLRREAALLRRAATEAAGGAGGGREEGLRGRRPAAFARALPWGGGPGFSLSPPALGVRDWPPPPPLPGRGKGRPHFPAPLTREHPPGEGTEVPSLQHLDSGSLTGAARGQCPDISLLSPSTPLPPLHCHSPPSLPGRGAARRIRILVVR